MTEPRKFPLHPIGQTDADFAPPEPRARGTLPDFTPVPRLKERSNGWSPQVQRAFIEALADTGSVEAACRQVNRASVGAYLLRRHPEGGSFRAAWDAALQLGVQKIEDVAMERALNGVEVPVYSYGKLVGTRRVYNDRLLMFMLRNRAPARFAADGARGMSALDRTTLTRLKKEWREEWEREQGVVQAERERDATDSLLGKLDRMHRNWFASLGPQARAAYLEFRRLERQNPFHPGSAAEAGAEDQAATEADYAQAFGPGDDPRRARIWKLIDMRGAGAGGLQAEEEG